MTATTQLRRAVTIPVVTAFELVVVASAPVLVPLAALVSLPDPDRRLLRSTRLVIAYAVAELRAFGDALGMLRGGGSTTAYYQLMREFLDRLYAAIHRHLGVTVVVDPASVPDETVRSASPLVVLSRHAGPGDSFLVVWLLMQRWRLRPRIVMRRALRWEPAVDLIGSVLPHSFVRAGHPGRTKGAIASLAAGLAEGDALLLFPEGGNFSVERRLTRITRLHRRGDHLEARRARRMRHVVAPHPGGALAAIGAAPGAHVLLLAHTGLAPQGKARRPWWSLPVDQELRVMTWLVQPAEIPADEQDREAWLYAAWARVDAWIGAAQAPAPAPTDTGHRQASSRSGPA